MVDGSIVVNLKTTVRWQHGWLFDIYVVRRRGRLAPG